MVFEGYIFYKIWWARAALPLTLGVADGSGRVWGCCAQLAEAVGAS